MRVRWTADTATKNNGQLHDLVGHCRSHDCERRLGHGWLRIIPAPDSAGPHACGLPADGMYRHNSVLSSSNPYRYSVPLFGVDEDICVPLTRFPDATQCMWCRAGMYACGAERGDLRCPHIHAWGTANLAACMCSGRRRWRQQAHTDTAQHSAQETAQHMAQRVQPAQYPCFTCKHSLYCTAATHARVDRLPTHSSTDMNIVPGLVMRVVLPASPTLP